MSFEPKNIFVGLIDFFSILLPGAVLTYLVKEDLLMVLLQNPNPQFTEVEGWAVFLFSSYLTGHFVFLLGSVLDDFYDVIRNSVDANQIAHLAEGKGLSPRWARVFAGLVYKKENNQAVNLAKKIKEHYLNPLLGSDAVNTFQWGKAKLALEAPEAAASVQRFEADSKFFRSLFVVLFILFFLGLAKDWPGITLAIIPFLALASFWRYVEQRLKSTNQVYWYVITQEGSKENGFRQEVPVRLDCMTHAGGVVFRRLKDQLEYLVVQAKKDPKTWVLPKGQIKPAETLRETALREVHEETGVWAHITDELSISAYSVGSDLVKVQFYLMEEAGKGKLANKDRKSKWLSFNEAKKQLRHLESCELLIELQEKLTTQTQLLPTHTA